MLVSDTRKKNDQILVFVGTMGAAKAQPRRGPNVSYGQAVGQAVVCRLREVYRVGEAYPAYLPSDTL